MKSDAIIIKTHLYSLFMAYIHNLNADIFKTNNDEEIL